MENIKVNKKLQDRLKPPQMLAAGFAFLILVGTLLLNTSYATKTGEQIGLLNALFTATSATCVTGLTVVNTAETFSDFGHLVIIILIQMGGLGFMTMSSLLAVILRRKITYRDRLTIKEQLNLDTRTGLVRFVIYVAKITFIIEAVTALALSFRFVPEFGFEKGLWYSVFHGISAFCNAGFDLFGNSLMNYQDDVLVNVAISLAIIIGGLGFVVYQDIIYKKKFKRFHLQSKIVLSMTAALLIVGTLVFLVLEWSNPSTIGGESIKNKVIGAFFQSVTARTAGFNTVELSFLRDSSAFFMMVLMFIGASSGSTGGGLKVTTFSVIALTTYSVIKGNEDVHVFGRRLSADTIKKSVAIAMACLIVVVVTIFVLTMLESAQFITLSYEVVSAFATVGVSQGITAALRPISKFIIILTMYVGRLGPLTLIYVFNTKGTPKKYRYAEGHISVG